MKSAAVASGCEQFCMRHDCTTMKVFFATVGAAALAASEAIVHDASKDVTYRGFDRSNIEVFLDIPYGQDTSGAHRFKPPRAYAPRRGETINATAYGPACPQPLGPWVSPISLSNVTRISEDCLNLNVARPRCTRADAKLPVMVYIHGGSFWAGQNSELNIRPDGMILESLENGLPIIHVAMNYRLGCKSTVDSWRVRS